MKRVLDVLTSVRLAVVIIAVLAILSGLSTLVPQGLDPGWYRAAYPAWLSGAVLGLSFHRFFSSVLFAVPAAAFVVNLLACTLKRFAAQLRLGKRGRHGPDVLHLGILMLAAAGLASALTQAYAPVRLAVGDAIELAQGTVVTVAALEAPRHPDGRPIDWITRLRVTGAGRTGGADADDRGRDASVSVNHPFHADGIGLYQYSWEEGDTVRVATADGERRLGLDEELELDDGRRVAWAADLSDTATGLRAAGLVIDGEPVGLRVGDEAYGVRLLAMGPETRTVLLVGRDPAYPLVLAAFVVLCAGLAMVAWGRVRAVLKEED